ncbi:MAG: flagellar hook-associated protein FlgK [Acidobacteriota bacterium]|nr:flagellar hook-associated protein FlgK [Acidobacteriota bacterium]
MGSLSGSLSIALQALSADQGAVAVTTNNVANANTPGYAREVPVFQENPPLNYGSLQIGTGVSLGQTQSIRDNILQIRIDQESQQSGQLNSFVNSMQQMQALFNEASGAGLQTPMAAFFNAWQQLASDPTNLNYRQNVITAAQNLADAFHQISSGLTSQQTNLDLSVQQDVKQVNQLTTQIAQFNGQVAAMSGAGQDASGLVDQRDPLIQQRSGLIDVSYVSSGENSLTVTTTSGAPLVVGNQSFSLATGTDPTTGLTRIFSQGTDVTSNISSGQIAGELQARDQQIPATLAGLDTLAAGIANAVNAQSAAGYDLNGNAGGNFFVPPPAGGAGAAAALQVAITDPALVAASSDGTTGSNGNASAMAAIANQTVVAGQTPASYYSGMVFQIGSTVSNAQTEQSANQLVLQQLENQRGAVSGVSLDQEAADLIQYQQAYDAMARVITIISDLTQSAVQLGKD